MLNKIFLMGRLTRDPELRRTGSGLAVASFSLAVDRDFKSQSGEKETDFIDIVAWRNTAEFVSKYFSKGRMAVVEGRLQVRDWTDKNGGQAQITMVFEEMAELQDVLCKFLRGRIDGDTLANIAEEIADVGIMLDQMAIEFKVEDAVAEQRAVKIRRLRSRLGYPEKEG